MSKLLNPVIEYATLDWQTIDGIEIPISTQFGDVYFSRANGLAEAQHVFLQGNNLAERLSGLQSHQYFCVGETGFGTGLSILALWQCWQQCRPNNHSRLHVLTVEKSPLSLADLTRALNAWPALAHLSSQLLAQYPPALPGCHRLVFAHERFSIDLWLGDAAEALSLVQTTHPIDAWFLDGFAPTLNPDIWQDTVLSQVIRLSAVGTTFASFSVAGVVKRGLTAHGIQVKRSRGFAAKRHMLTGIWSKQLENHKNDEDHENKASLDTQSIAQQISTPNRSDINFKFNPKIAVIGAGIAGLSMAHALSQRGYACHLFDSAKPLHGASGNPRALIAPRITALEKFSNNLMNIGGLYSMRYWQQYAEVIERTEILHIIEQRAEETLHHANQYSAEILTILDAKQTSHKATIEVLLPSICFTHNALLNPIKLAEHVLSHPLVHFHVADIKQLQSKGQQWQLINDQHSIVQINDTVNGTECVDPYAEHCFDHVIVCSALNSPTLCPSLKPFKPIRGQVSWFTHRKNSTPLIPVPMSYGGYIASLPDQEGTLLGASFIPDDRRTDIRTVDHQHNLGLLSAVSPALAHALPPLHYWQGRASIRAQSPDYLPFIGQVPNMPNVWTLSGLGSKGFSVAPLGSEFICAQLLGEVWPITQQVAQTISPARFIKKEKVRKPYYQKPPDANF